MRRAFYIKGEKMNQKPQFAEKNTNGLTAVKATKQNQHGAKINAPRKAGI